MRTLVSLIAVLALLLTACSSADGPTSHGPATASDQMALKRLGAAGMSGQQIIEKLDTSATSRPLKHLALGRPGQVLLGDDQGQTAVELPKGTFYLSIVPYAERTHQCFFHSLPPAMANSRTPRCRW